MDIPSCVIPLDAGDTASALHSLLMSSCTAASIHWLSLSAVLFTTFIVDTAPLHSW